MKLTAYITITQIFWMPYRRDLPFGLDVRLDIQLGIAWSAAVN
jgi:hypothetical protein